MENGDLLTNTDEAARFLADNYNTEVNGNKVRHGILSEVSTESYIVQGTGVRTWAVSAFGYGTRPDGTEYEKGAILGSNKYITEDKVFFRFRLSRKQAQQNT